MRVSALSNRRPAVAGIVAMLIMFVALFTVGSGYFFYQSVLGHNYDVANASIQQEVRAKASEQLTLSTFLSGSSPPTLEVIVTNTGGISIVIASVYVQDQTKTLECMSQSPANTGLSPVSACGGLSPALTIASDLGTKKTIDTGQTSCSSGCKLACSQTATCALGVITQRGNIFTQVYPLPPTASGILTSSDSISTQLSATSITFGGSVFDTATLTGVTSGAGGTVTYYFFDNPGHSDNTCSSAGAIVSMVTVTNGIVLPSGARSFPDATYVGSYSWDAVYSGDPNNNAATSPCEPMNVVKYTPTLTTTLANGGVITTGASETDSATISGSFSSQPTGSITFQVFAPSCSGSPLPYFPGPATSSVKPIVGGSATSDSITPPAVGTYYFTATYPGDSNYNGVTSQCELLVVQTVTSPSKVTPVITTTLSPTSAVAGTAVTDSATFQNTSPAPSGLIAFVAYSTSSCSGAPVYQSNPLVVNGLGPWGPSSPNFYPSVVGSPSYYFRAIYTGDSTYNPVTTPCIGPGSEPLTVTKATPTVTTTLSSVNIVAGQSVTDTATLAGSSGSNAGGMVTFYYSTTNACPTGGATIVLPVVPVSGGIATSSPVYFPSTGTYYWYAVYSAGDNNNNAGATSPCEPLSVVTATSAAGGGLGSIQMDFSSFKWFSTGGCNPTASTACTLTPWNAGGGVKNDPNLAYTVSRVTMTGSPHVFSVNITNADPQKRTIFLDQFTQILFFDPTSNQQPSGEFLFVVSVNLANGHTIASTPSVTLTFGQTTTVFFGIQGAGSFGNIGSAPRLTSEFLFFHGTIGGGPAGNYGQNIPFATTEFT